MKVLLLLLVLVPQAAVHSQEVVENIATTCDYNTDSCPYQFNRYCQDGRNACAQGDCYDCDPCHDYHYDCAGCVSHGCQWCPGDAFCNSVPLEPPFWERVADLLYRNMSSSCPLNEDWKTSCEAIHTDNVYTDPLFDSMKWSFQLMQVEPVWRRNITGRGVRVRINDNGVDHLHAEFDDRFDIDASCDEFAPRDFEEDTHGTAVASIVAGGANNSQCAVGIAPNARISSCVHSLEAISPLDLGATLESKVDQMDISVNAWGMLSCYRTRPSNRRRRRQLYRFLQDDDNCIFPRDHPFSPCGYCQFDISTDEISEYCQSAIANYCAVNFENDAAACSLYLDLFTTCNYNVLTEDQEAALQNGIQNGRNGKGIIFVFSSGNSYYLGVDANFDGWANTRYTISVGGVGKDGLHASYSTPGAALFVSGPGGDRENLRNNIVAQPGGGCTDITVGTSFSSPAVAGVVALLLEANPELSWRDVQAILALTSTKTDPTDDSWMSNAAGVNHSYKYGFGLVNADRAVDAALTWTNLEAEEEIIVDSGEIDLSIADDPSVETSSVIRVDDASGAGVLVESVEVYLDLFHGSRGDLELVLTSPRGTQSILHPGRRPENTFLASNERWKLMTVRNWGESATGDWNLTLIDKRAGVLSNCQDIPFEYTWEGMLDESMNGAVTTCATLEAAGGCDDGRPLYNFVLQLETNGLSAVDACCTCGGGMEATGANVLRSWRLVVYGHRGTTNQPSTSPTSTPMDVTPEILAQLPFQSRTSSLDIQPRSAQPTQNQHSNDNTPSSSRRTTSIRTTTMIMTSPIIIRWFIRRRSSHLLWVTLLMMMLISLLTFHRVYQVERQLTLFHTVFEESVKQNYISRYYRAQPKQQLPKERRRVRIISLLSNTTTTTTTPKTNTTTNLQHQQQQYHQNVHFLNRTHVARRDVFSASWLQSMEDFSEMNLTRITFCEAAAFAAFARRTDKLRMTLDYLDFSIEHLSKWWKILYFQKNPVAYESMIRHLTHYIVQRHDDRKQQQQQQHEPIFGKTLAMIAFMPYGRKDNDERGFHLTVVALAATLESLRRAEMGRVVVVGLLPDDPIFVRQAFRFLADHVPLKHQFRNGRLRKIGHMEVDFIQGSLEYGYTEFDPKNVPRAALFGVREALNISLMDPLERNESQTKYMNEWFGQDHEQEHEPAASPYWKYLYLTEPDSILQTRPNTLQQIKDEVDKGGIFAPHRLQPIPHESDLRGMDPQFYRLEERDGFNNVLELDSFQHSHDVCCDEYAGRHFKPGLDHFVECGKGRWWACGFGRHQNSKQVRRGGEDNDDNDNSKDDPHIRLRPYQMMRLTQGVGLVTIAGTLHGRRCIAAKNAICKPPAWDGTADDAALW